MILATELQENWDTFPDTELKEKVGINGVLKAMKAFAETTDDDDYVWYPFKAIYDFAPIKGKVDMPSGELEKKINEWVFDMCSDNQN